MVPEKRGLWFANKQHCSRNVDLRPRADKCERRTPNNPHPLPAGHGKWCKVLPSTHAPKGWDQGIFWVFIPCFSSVHPVKLSFFQCAAWSRPPRSFHPSSENSVLSQHRRASGHSLFNAVSSPKKCLVKTAGTSSDFNLKKKKQNIVRRQKLDSPCSGVKPLGSASHPWCPK